MTGDLHQAEDVVQEALARAAARWARLCRYDAPEAWVRRVALNLATSQIRHRTRQLAILARIARPAAVPPVSEEAMALVQALGRLPMSQRGPVVLHHLLGVPVEEVAEQLGISAGAVKSRLLRGRRALAVLLDDVEDAEGVGQHA